MLKKIFSILIPHECVHCSKIGQYLCSSCEKQLIPSLPECYICRRLSNQYVTHEQCKSDTATFDKVIYLYKYGDIPRKLITKYKIKSHKSVSKAFIYLINKSDLIKSILVQDHSIQLINIPIHRSRQNERGFNQLEPITSSLADKFEVQYNSKYLKRNRSTKYQRQIEKSSRGVNLIGAISVNIHLQTNLPDIYIIFDDILTTGATIDEAARAIVKAEKRDRSKYKIVGICMFRGRAYWSEKSSK